MATACGDKNCSSSTGIHGGITCGKGVLDQFGFWEFPCRPCAKKWDDKRAQYIERLNAEGIKLDDLDSDEYDWVTTPAWPYADADNGTEDNKE